MKKRQLDIIFSLLVLLLLAPLFLLIALIIALSSRGKVIYTQPRLGKKGKIFRCYKFRTMYMDADDRLEHLLRLHPSLKLEWEEKQKLRNDPRIFPMGHLLRKTSLDELPQFFNVLKGDLSVVGPRPYMVFQEKLLGKKRDTILSIRPGITGLWQTSGRSGTTFQKRIKLDAAYVKKRGFWLDLRLIFKTIPVVLFPKDAF